MQILALALSSLMLSSAAHAALPRLAPAAGEAPTCFKREYTAEHMRKNPGQLLDKMYVKVSRVTERSEGETWSWMPAEVVGVSRGEYFGNTAGCSVAGNGSIQCAIDCDGGSFSLNHSSRVKGAVNFAVTKDYYFPLFKNRMSYDESEEGSVSLGDKDNSIFRLSPVDVRECNEAIKSTLGQGEGGC
jgi:hypothetical protein